MKTQKKKIIFNKFKRDDVKILAEMSVFDNFHPTEMKDKFCDIFSLRDYKRVKKRVAFILDTSDRSGPFTKIPEQQSRIDTLGYC